MVYHIMQCFGKNMFQNNHGWSSNMDTLGKQYNVTTFLVPLIVCFHENVHTFLKISSWKWLAKQQDAN
jgi:hypothetical protein